MIALEAQNISKVYRIGAKESRHDTFMGLLVDMVRNPLRNLRNLKRTVTFSEADKYAEDCVWALKDVSFKIEQGDVVGIIGHNGAGKSTLLKVLSRITTPTSGRAAVNGRISSLLEVGTGFHPELTGRENVFLNGVILGMTRGEVASKFDEIVAFAEVEKFIDTPVKRYSSGMRLRLAFSVAAHLDSEIILIDEVLAVGDVAFQKKCLGKMDDVAKCGRTVLFVSHSMSSVLALCKSAMWIDAGTIRMRGSAGEVIDEYLREGILRTDGDLTSISSRSKRFDTIMRSVRLNGNTAGKPQVETGGALRFEVLCKADTTQIRAFCLGFAVKDAMGSIILAANMQQYELEVKNEKGGCKLGASIKNLPLNPGTYSISLYLSNGAYEIDVVENAVYFDVVWNSPFSVRMPPRPYWGATFAPVTWKMPDKG